MQNRYVESFDGRMRDELLNDTHFHCLDRARMMTSGPDEDYNNSKPIRDRMPDPRQPLRGQFCNGVRPTRPYSNQSADGPNRHC